MKLTNKQLKFCQEYIIDLNATQAAIRAGYLLKDQEVDVKTECGHDSLSKPIS